MTASPSPRKPRRSVLVSLLAAIGIAAAALLAGVRWHAPLARLLGEQQPTSGTPQGSNTRQLWTCGMHPRSSRTTRVRVPSATWR